MRVMYPLPDPPAAATPRRFGLGRRVVAGLSVVAAALAALPMLAEADPGLAPTATASGCRPAGEQMQCAISVSFNAVAGAEHYTASIQSPGGVVTPYGQIMGPATGRVSALLRFPYSGDGGHRVVVRAFGVSDTGALTGKLGEEAGVELPDLEPGPVGG